MLDHLSSKAKYTYDAWGNHKIQYLNANNEFVDIEENYVYNDVSNMNRFVDGVDAIVKKNKPQAIKSLVKNSLYSSIRFNLYNFGNGIIFR